MRILLLQPPWPEGQVGFHRVTMPDPLPLELIAAPLLEENEIEILDMRLEPDKLNETLLRFQPNMVGTTGYTCDVLLNQEILHQVKQTDPKIFTVVGGHHASLIPADFNSPDVDTIVTSEGEETFTELVNALNAGQEWRTVP